MKKLLNKIISVLMTICIVLHPVRSAFPAELNIVVESDNAVVDSTTTPGVTTVTALDSDPMRLNFKDAGLDIATDESLIIYVLTLDTRILAKDLTGSASSIWGTLECRDMDGNIVGTLLIYNPSGIEFGSTANVNVGNLIASTLHISDEDFIDGNYTFRKLSDEAAQILNQGRLVAAKGGFIALLSDSIKNDDDGYISAEQGSVVLASGEAMTLSFDNDGLIQVAISDATQSKIDSVEDAIVNTGTIQANSGLVLIKAKIARDLFTNAVNNDGVIQATRVVEGKDGSIEIIAEGGDIALSGGSLKSDHTTLNADKVKLLGTDPYYFYGDMTIHNFECLTPGKEIYFEAGKAYTFKDTLDIGPHSKNLPVYMQSTDPGSLWYINIEAEDPYVQRVAVSDSYNLSDTTIDATPSLNWGNNTGWNLNTIYWAGGGDGNWGDPGNWDPEGDPGGQGVIFNSTYDPGNTSSYINGTYYITSLTVDSSWSGYIYLIGGDLHVTGNFTLDNGYFDGANYGYTTYFDGSSNDQYIDGYGDYTIFDDIYLDNSGGYTVYLSDNLYVAGNFTLNNGYFDASGYTTYFNGSSDYQYIDGGMYADFSHIELSNSSYTIYLSDDLYVAGNFTQSAGYFDANSYTTYFLPDCDSADQYIDGNGSSTVFNNVVVNGSSYYTYLYDDLYLKGNFTDNNGYFNGTGYTVYFNGGNYQDQYIDGSSGTRFSHIYCDTSSYCVYLYDDLYVEGNFTLNSGSFDATGYTVYFDPSNLSADQCIDGGSSANFDKVEFTSGGSYYTYLSDDLYLDDNFVDNSGYFNGSGYTVYFNGGNYQDQYIDGSSGTRFSHIYCDTSSYYVYLYDDLYVQGNFTLNSGSFDANGYTVYFDPSNLSANQYINAGSSANFDKVDFTSGGSYYTYLDNDLHLDDNFVDNSGYFDGSGYTVYFNGGNAADQYIDGDSGTRFGHIYFNTSGYTVYLSDDLYVQGNLTLNSSGYFNATGYTIYFDPSNLSADQYIDAGSNANFDAVDFTSGGSYYTYLSSDFYLDDNFTDNSGYFDGNGYTVYFDGGNSQDQYIDGASGTRFGNIDCDTSSYYVYLSDDLYLKGNFTLSSSYFDANSYTVNFVGGSADQYIDGGMYADFDHMVFDNNGYTVYLSDDLYVSGNLTQSNGSFDAATYTTYFSPDNISASQYIDGNGSSTIFDHVVFNGSGYTTYLSDDLYVSGNFTDNNGKFYGTGYTVYFDGGLSQDQYIDTSSTNTLFGKMDFGANGYTVYLSDHLKVEGNVTLSAGNFDANSYTVYFNTSNASEHQYINGGSNANFDKVDFTSGGSYYSYLSGDLYLDDNFVDNSGYFNANGNTVYFDGGNSQDQYIDTSSTSTIFDHIDFGANGYTVYLSDNLQVEGNLTLSAGSFDSNSHTVYFSPTAAHQYIDGGANANFDAVQFNDGGSGYYSYLSDNFYVEGNFTDTAGYFDGVGYTVYFDGGNGASQFINGHANTRFGHIDCNTSSYFVYLSDNLYMKGNFTLSSGSFDAQGYTAYFNPTVADQYIDAGGSAQFDAVDFTSGGTYKTYLSDNLYMGGNFTDNSGYFDGGGYTVYFDGGNTANQYIDGAAGTRFGHIDLGATSYTVFLSDDLYVEGNFTLSAGSFDAQDTHTTYFNGVAAQAIDAGTSADFYDVEFGNSAVTWTLSDSLNVARNLTVTNGILDVGNNNQIVLAAGGTLSLVGGTIRGSSNNVNITAPTITYTTGSIATTTSGTITLNGAGVFTLGNITSAGTIDIGQTTPSSSLTQSNGTTIQTVNAAINITSAGAIAVEAIDSGTATTTIIATAGAITDGNGASTNFTAGTLDITAQDDIGTVADPMEADITTLTATSTGGGDIYIDIIGDEVIVDGINQNYDYNLSVNKTVDIRNLTVTGAGNAVNVTTSSGDIIVENITCSDVINLTSDSGSLIGNGGTIQGTQGTFTAAGVIGSGGGALNVDMESLEINSTGQRDGYSCVLSGSPGSVTTNNAPGMIILNGKLIYMPSAIEKVQETFKTVTQEEAQYETSNPVLAVLKDIENTVAVPHTYEAVSPYIDTTEYVLESPYEFGTGSYLQ